MKQEAFETRYRDTWDRYEDCLQALRKSRRAGARTTAQTNRETTGETTGQTMGREFPALYRQICHHLALTRARRYSAGLEQRLSRLALDGHQHLYRTRLPFVTAFLRFFARDFPQAFRRHWRFTLAAHLVFYLPAVGMATGVLLKPDLIYSMISPADVASLESMYDPENRRLGRERQADTDLMMFGFYIYNNISIGFQTFAGGLLFGVGSVFYLVFNGIYLGAVAAHLTAAGFVETFYTFVIAHGAFELTAIAIFGAAGLKLGYSAIVPGRKRRWHAIRDAALQALPLVYGGTFMLLVAAFVEAFWSSTSWPPAGVKYAVGAVLWAFVYAYLLLPGRDES